MSEFDDEYSTGGRRPAVLTFCSVTEDSSSIVSDSLSGTLSSGGDEVEIPSQSVFRKSYEDVDVDEDEDASEEDDNDAIRPETPAVSTLEEKFNKLNELAPKLSDKPSSNEESESFLVNSKSGDNEQEDEECRDDKDEGQNSVDQQTADQPSNVDPAAYTVKNNSSDSSDLVVDFPLEFSFRGKKIPVTFNSCMSRASAADALSSKAFMNWAKRSSRIVGTKRIDIHGVNIDSIDFAHNLDADDHVNKNINIFSGGRPVEAIKIKAHCTILDEDSTINAQGIPGNCFLKEDAVGILVKLVCVQDGSIWSLLVERPRVAIGAVAAIELPTGTIDDDSRMILGETAELMKKVCKIKLNVADMTNLTEKAFNGSWSRSNGSGLSPMPGSCSESVTIMLKEQKIQKSDLQKMRCHLSDLRERGEALSLRVVPLDDIWKISSDTKVMCALFLMSRIGSEQGQSKNSTGIQISKSFEEGRSQVRRRVGTLFQDVRKNFRK